MAVPDPLYDMYRAQPTLNFERAHQLLLSDSNIAHVNQQIIATVKDLTSSNVTIGPQRPASVRMLLQRTMKEWFHDRSRFKDVPASDMDLVSHINSIVVPRAAKICLMAYRAQQKLHRDQDVLVEPLALPSFESVRGTYEAGDMSGTLEY